MTFVHAWAQDAVSLASGADAAFLCNVIHQMPPPERHGVCTAAYQMLKPGGRLGVSTLFCEGSISPATRRFYLLWMQGVRTYLKAHGADMNVMRVKPASLQFFTATEHRELLTQSGFTQVEVEEPVVPWSPEDWQALSMYSVFIQGALGPEIDPALGSEALRATAAGVYEKLGVTQVPRGWVHVVGRKPRG